MTNAQDIAGDFSNPSPIQTGLRAFSLIIFHKLHREFSHLSDDLSALRAESLVLEAINLLPTYRAEPGKKRGVILIFSTEEPLQAVELSIQGLIDSLRIVWKDYREAVVA